MNVHSAIRLALLLGACGPSGPSAALTGAWPNDALLGDDGKLHVSTPFPFDSSNEDNLTHLAASLSQLDGFGVTGSCFFPVSADVTVNAGATAQLVDLEDGSSVDFPLFYRADRMQLVAVAPLGSVLEEHHPYACVIAKGVASLHPSSEMSDALAGRGPTAGRGAWPQLVARAKSLPSVQAAVAFTTQSLTAWLPPVLAALAAAPPKAHFTRLFKGSDLDTLYGGQVTTTLPGRPASGGVLHDAVAFALEGTFDVPHYLSATPPKLGLFSDPPVPKATEAVPFMLVLPKRTSYAATPVLIFQHGIDDDRHAVLEVSNSFAAAGYAVLGIDELFHGSRRPGAQDLVNNICGAMVPDGIGDPSAAGAIQYFFDFKGDATQGIDPLDSRSIRDNLRQGAIDLMQEVRFARAGDVSELAAADPALAGLTLDASKLVYMSESFGSILGAIVMALDPMLPAAVLDVGGGGIIIDLVPNSAQFAVTLQAFATAAFDDRLVLDMPAVLPVHAQMSLVLLETALEAGDPLALARGADPSKQVLFLEAFSDETVPNQSTEALAHVWGVTQVQLAHGSIATKQLDFPQANAPYSASPLRALVELDPASHPMFTVQNGERNYQPGFPPFVKMTKQTFDEPIALVHALAIGVAQSSSVVQP
jgi:hypothetical protein